jgi:hypothetical protein
MDSTVPADLLKLKARLEAWRATRKYARQPIPDEFRQAAAEMTERHPVSLVRRILKLDPWRMKKPATKKSDRACHKPQTAFFTLPPEPTLLLPGCASPKLRPACISNNFIKLLAARSDDVVRRLRRSRLPLPNPAAASLSV